MVKQKISGLVQVWRDGGREFRIVRAARLKLQAPNDVWTNVVERRLVLESEGLSRMTGMKG